MKRPLWTVGLCLALGTLAAALIPLRLSLGIGAVCFVLAIGAVCLPDWRHTAAPAVLFTTAAALFLFLIHTVRVVLPAEAYIGSTVTVTGEVREAEREYAVLRVTDGDLPKGVSLIVRTAQPAEAGQIMHGECTLRRTADTFADVRIQTSDPLTVEAGTGAVYRLSMWRKRLASTFDRIGGQTGEILCAMCMGDDRGIDDAAYLAFRRAGTAHLLCVSGLHVSVIATAVWGLLSRIRRLRILPPLLAMAAVVLYMGLTGFHYAVLRAGLMQLLFLLGLVLRREPDGRNSLGFAVTLILLFDPAAVYDAGFWLSVCATAGLLILYPALRRAVKKRQKPGEQPRWRRMGRALLDSMLLSACAVAAITPVSLLIFRQFTWISPLSNLFAVPMATPLVVTGCLAALFGLVPALSFLTVPLLFCAGLCARWINFVSELFAKIPFATVTVRSPWLIAWIIGSMGLAAILWRLSRGKGLRVAAVASAVALVCGTALFTGLTHDVTTLRVLSVGDGTAVLVQNRQTTGAVVFGGGRAVAYPLRTALSEYGADTLDWLVAADKQWESNDAFLSAFADRGGKAERIYDSKAFSEAGEGEIVLADTVGIAAQGGGFVTLRAGETAVLFCPVDGDAAALPAEKRSAQLLIFDRVPPLHVTALTGRHAVFSSDAAALPGATKALPWGAVPLSLTADGDVTVLTRGRGDTVCREEGSTWR